MELEGRPKSRAGMERLLCLTQSRAALRETGALPRRSLQPITTATPWMVRSRILYCLQKAVLHGVLGPESRSVSD